MNGDFSTLYALHHWTFAKFAKWHCKLEAHCWSCWRVVTIEYAELMRLGDRMPVKARPRCRMCGAIGGWNVLAPRIERTGSKAQVVWLSDYSGRRNENP